MAAQTTLNPRVDSPAALGLRSLDAAEPADSSASIPFASAFAAPKNAMIIARAPVRVSFLGGGSDFTDHFRQHGGAVLATAIDRFAYVTVQPFLQEYFDH